MPGIVLYMRLHNNLAEKQNPQGTTLTVVKEYYLPEGIAMAVTVVQEDQLERMDVHQGSCIYQPSM